MSQEHEDESKSRRQSRPSRSNDSENSEPASKRLPKKKLKQSPSSGRIKNSRQHRHSSTARREDLELASPEALKELHARSKGNQTTVSAAVNHIDDLNGLNKNPAPAHNNYVMNLSNQFSQ